MQSISLLKPIHSSDWHVEFPNPLLRDAWDESAVVRRSLRTTNRDQAEGHLSELEELLKTENVERFTRGDIRDDYSEVVIDAVFSGAGDEVNYEKRRSDALRLPWHEEDYTRVMLVGTTGAGKTTLLRNLIGSNHHTDKFPSTSTGRTTTADIEIITGRDRYKGVVTFQNEPVVRAELEECVVAAALESLQKNTDAEVADALLEHQDQTFRLKYILGDWEEERSTSQESSEDGMPTTDSTPATSAAPTSSVWANADKSEEDEKAPEGISEEERTQFQQALNSYVGRIAEIADAARNALEKDLGVSWDEDKSLFEGVDQEVEDILERFIRRSPGFTDLVNDILDEIKKRFQWIQNPSAVNWSSSGWPITWEYETSNREEFLKRMRWFASNFAPWYGKLLTPIVQGMRVQGPFQSDFAKRSRNFVFIDGKGLGHKASEAGSITSSVTSRFGNVDVILVVDNAQQPMQKNPLKAIKRAAVGGHVSKLAVAFTHFDNVQGDNLPGMEARENHIKRALRQGISTLEEEERVSDRLIQNLKETSDERTFILGWLHQATSKMKYRSQVEHQIHRMFDWFEEVAEPTDAPKATPVYDINQLLSALRAGNRNFLKYWRGLLGLSSDEGPQKEHWTRIKALNRRVVEHRDDYEYKELHPIGDLISFVIDEMSLEFEHPLELKGYGADARDEKLAVERVRQELDARLHKIFPNRLVHEKFEEWKTAYSFRGTGSTKRRAKKLVNDIFDPAAPEFRNVDDSALSVVFDDSLINHICEAIEAAGAQVKRD